MPSCSARGCKNRSGAGPGKCTFHIFPKNNEARQLWIPATGRKNWTPGKRSVLCSDHFEEACFDRTGQTTRLRAGAVPTKGKFAPKIRKKPIHIKMEPQEEPEVKQPVSKLGITTRSGRQLSARMVAAVAAIKREDDVETIEPDDPPPLDIAAEPPAADPAVSALPDHFYCRTQNEMQALLRKSEQKVEFLRMKLEYLSNPKKIMKKEPPDWSQFRRASLQKEAELIKASLQAGSPSPDSINTKDLLEKDEHLKEKLQEAEDLQKQIKTLQQKNRRLAASTFSHPQKKRSKARFIRYVVMIEPADSEKKSEAKCSIVREEDEEDEGSKEDGTAPTVEQVSSIQQSILKHTASMFTGSNGLLDEKDRQIQELQKKVRIARQKEKRKAEQVEHLQEVVEILKERCPEYSTEKEEPTTQRHCSLCHSPLLKRCHQIAESWAAFNTDQDLTLPLMRPKILPRSPTATGSGSWRGGNGVFLCSECQAMGSRSRLKQRRSLVCRLRPQC